MSEKQSVVNRIINCKKAKCSEENIRVKRYVPKTYNNRRVLRILIRTVVAVFVILIIVFVSLFFGLRKYVVYSADGMIRLEIPFLMDETPPEPNGTDNADNAGYEDSTADNPNPINAERTDDSNNKDDAADRETSGDGDKDTDDGADRDTNGD